MSNLTAAKRREILEDLRDGSCLGVFATSALELGIDIGDLSAAIILGTPHSRPSYRQMAGRVGRRSPAIVVYVPRDKPLDNWFADDHWFASHLATAEPEPVITDPENDDVAMLHLAAAAKEMDINCRTDEPFFGKRLKERLRILDEAGDIQERKKGLFYWASADAPFVRINCSPPRVPIPSRSNERKTARSSAKWTIGSPSGCSFPVPSTKTASGTLMWSNRCTWGRWIRGTVTARLSVSRGYGERRPARRSTTRSQSQSETSLSWMRRKSSDGTLAP
jgi:superfamily II DNA/RNA helicase